MIDWNHLDIKIDIILTTITVISRISVDWLIRTIILVIIIIIDLNVIKITTRKTHWETAQRRRKYSFQQQHKQMIIIIAKIIIITKATLTNKAIAADYIHNQCKQLYHQTIGARGLILTLTVATESSNSNKSSTEWANNHSDKIKNNNIIANHHWKGWIS